VESLLDGDGEEQRVSKLSRQALWFLIHTVIALASWLALMLVGYALNPPGVSQTLILILSIFVPLVVGHFVTRFHPDDMAAAVWLLGLIWLLIISLWILDMPTGPNQCFNAMPRKSCRGLFSVFPSPAG